MVILRDIAFIHTLFNCHI